MRATITTTPEETEKLDQEDERDGPQRGSTTDGGGALRAR
jgi:hypothetical protein